MQATILEHSPDGVLVVGDDGSIELSNRAAQHIFALTPGAPLSIERLIPAFKSTQLRPQAGVQRIEARRLDGSEFPAEVACGFAPHDDGARSILIVRDISAQALLEQQLARARQLEVAGRVASGVAHDLNNLLSVVWMSTYLIQRAPASELPALLHDLENAISLGAALTTRLLSMARRHGGEPRALAVNDALRAIVRLARRAMSPRVELILEFDPHAGAILLEPAQLDQIILNLTLNADLAMPEGGRLTIRSSASTSDGDAVVVIEVEDTGVGIDPAVQARLFEPFFTTRSSSGGTGLGLSIVKDIVEQVGGELTFESELGRGTMFRFTIARHADAATELDEQAAGESPVHGGGRTILIVDDDELHRRSMSRLLEAWGFRPLSASGPGEAMLMAERFHEPLALAIVDMEMPYMDGRELSERLRKLHRNLPILLVSGSPSGFDLERSVDIDSRRLGATLRKPLEPDMLFVELARLLPAPRGLA